MKLDYSKIKLLQNTHNLSDRAMGRKIGMSHTGYAGMMERKSCSVETLVTISEAFQKPILYFFTNEDQNAVNEQNEVYHAKPPDSDKPDHCANPYCLKRENQLLEENRQLNRENRELREEIRALQKGGTNVGKSGTGGLEEPRATG